ncbi:MAG: hypothetical protein AAGG59_04585 [Bacteroidota bacterium]
MKRIWQNQCSSRDLFKHKCQGLKGRKGNHWQYKSDGSYHYWANKKDPGAIEKSIAMSTVPPGHDSYVEPLKKQVDYYMNFYETREVTDPKIIAKLEKNNPPEKEAVINRPLSKGEIEELEKPTK